MEKLDELYKQEIVKAIEKADEKALTDAGGLILDINFEIDDQGTTPLILAAAKTNLKFIDKLLKNVSLDLNKCDKNGQNAFFVAAANQKIDIMKRLYEAKIDIREKDS